MRTHGGTRTGPLQFEEKRIRVVGKFALHSLRHWGKTALQVQRQLQSCLL